MLKVGEKVAVWFKGIGEIDGSVFKRMAVMLKVGEKVAVWFKRTGEVDGSVV